MLSLDAFNFELGSMDYWRICDELSVVQAALLILGYDPLDQKYDVEQRSSDQQPFGYHQISTALKNAIMAGKISARIVELSDEYFGYTPSPKERINWNETILFVEDLKGWLFEKGVTSSFFQPTGSLIPDYLNPNSAHYAPKLAAAIYAWKAVTGDLDLLKSKTPKQALDVWLRKNADKFGLTKDDGNPNEQGIEEVSKIANWQQKGGAPKTPG